MPLSPRETADRRMPSKPSEVVVTSAPSRTIQHVHAVVDLPSNSTRLERRLEVDQPSLSLRVDFSTTPLLPRRRRLPSPAWWPAAPLRAAAASARLVRGERRGLPRRRLRVLRIPGSGPRGPRLRGLSDCRRALVAVVPGGAKRHHYFARSWAPVEEYSDTGRWPRRPSADPTPSSCAAMKRAPSAARPGSRASRAASARTASASPTTTGGSCSAGTRAVLPRRASRGDGENSR